MPVAAQIPPAKVIGEDENDIRLRARRQRGARKKNGQQDVKDRFHDGVARKRSELPDHAQS
ncbi:hypothetical protein D3C83_200810 [compost metagenome]